MEQKKRRTPYKSLRTTDVSDKFNETFMSSISVFGCRLEHDIEKHKTKVSNSINNSKSNTKALYE